MKIYKILRGSHGVWRDGLLKSFGPGDTTELTEREAANMVDLEGSQVRLHVGAPERPVSKPEPAAASPAEPEPAPEEPSAEAEAVEAEEPSEVDPDSPPTAPEPADYSSVLAGNVSDVAAAIEKMTDPEEIDALAEQEFQGKGGKEGGRKGVLNAARERLKELEGGEEG